MFQINPYSIVSDTNHKIKFTNGELSRILSFNSTGPDRWGILTLWAEFTFKYYIEDEEFDAMSQSSKSALQEQYRAVPYLYNFYVNCSAGFGVVAQCPWQQITVSYKNSSNVNVELKKIATGGVPVILNTNITLNPIIINDYVKSITVKLESNAIEPYIAMLGLKTEGVYDSRIRFKKDNTTYSLARYATNSGGGVKYKDADGVVRDLFLVIPGHAKTSPIRFKRDGIIFSIARI